MGGEALSKIKEVLDVYLQLPNYEDFEVGDNSIAALRLQATIQHAKSQVLLARATLQLKDATIRTLELKNYELQQEMEQLKGQPQKDKEDLITDVVSLSQFEAYGISINLAELLRKLKRNLGGITY